MRLLKGGRKNIDFSIGVCAYNEEKNIGRLLDALLSQKIDPKYRLKRILVVASGCTDKTSDIAQKIADKNSIVKVVTEEKRQGKASAINILLKDIKDGVFVLEAADTLPEDGSINKLLRPFKNPSVGAVGGRPVPMNNPKNFFGFVSQMIWNLHHRVSMYKSVKLSGEFCAFRAKLVNKVPHDIMVDDAFIESVIRQQGYKVVYVPDSVVYMRGPENILDFMNQRSRVHEGYFQIKKLFNIIIPTSNPLTIFKVLPIGEHTTKKEFSWAALAIALETYAYGLAFFNFFRGKKEFSWIQIKSTKDLGKDSQ